MQFNTLTLTLQNFIAAFSGGYARIQGAAEGLLAILVGIEVVLLGLWTALGGGENVVGVFKKILHIGAWVWVVQSYPTLCKALMQSLVQAGLTAGGGSGDVSLLMDPSRLAGYGLDATAPLTQKLADLHMTDLSDLFVFEFGYFAILACFLIMAIHVFLAVVEYYLFAALVGIFLPFGVFAPTKFLAEKAVGAVVAASVKLMVLAFVLSAVDPVLSQIHFQGPEITFNELWSVFLTACALMLLCWKAPNLAAALLGGSPHLGAGDVFAAVSTPIAAGMAAGALATRAAAGASAARAGASGGSGGGASHASSASSLGGSGSLGTPTSNEAAGGSVGKQAGGDGAAGGAPTAQPGASASLVQSAMGKTASSSASGAAPSTATAGPVPSDRAERGSPGAAAAPSPLIATRAETPHARSAASSAGGDPAAPPPHTPSTTI